MRIFFAPIIVENSPQTGMREAFRNAAGDGGMFYEFDWVNIWQQYGSERVRELYLVLQKRLQPELTFLQLQTADILTQKELNETTGFVMQWTGDMRSPIPQHYKDVGQWVNLSTFSNEKDVLEMRAAGLPAEFMQTGFSQTVFFEKGSFKLPPEIVFFGNNYGNRFPASAERKELVRFLLNTYGSNAGVYGNNWNKQIRWKNEKEEANIYNRAKIAIVQNHYNDVQRYTSDRMFRALGCGVMVLARYYPGIETDFTIGEHLDVWNTLEELKQKIAYYQNNELKRFEIAKNGARLAHQKHTWDARIPEILEFMKKYPTRKMD